ncbi:MAG TPA: NAD(P)-binding domain-containing protein [Ilumatobacteraceae bacterium]|nr:NAD(P)-binding domain-containing protein [Ilumatobacteraceae bacterium]
MPTSRHDVVIVGAGQAGLALSRCLSRRDIDHAVLERHDVASSWVLQRWDSLRLLTPNWMTKLPDAPAFGGPPDGFAPASEVAAHLRNYASHVAAPVIAGCPVDRIEPDVHGWRVLTPAGTFTARAVVLATGPASTPRIPGAASALAASTRTLSALDYKNPGDIEDGGVLVVGASASGTQIADELAVAGRTVTLAVGEHVRAVRSYRNRDLYWWLDRSGLLDESYDEVDDLRRVRSTRSFQLIGSDNGHNVDLNALQSRGVRLTGRLVGGDGVRAVFSGSLANLCTSADLKLERLLDRFDEFADARQLIDLPDPWRPARTHVPAPVLELRGSAVRTVIWATGFDPTFPAIDAPVFDRRRRLVHDGGVVGTSGLYVLGLPFLRRRRSSVIAGAEADAEAVAGLIRAQLDRRSVA